MWALLLRLEQFDDALAACTLTGSSFHFLEPSGALFGVRVLKPQVFAILPGHSGK